LDIAAEAFLWLHTGCRTPVRTDGEGIATTIVAKQAATGEETLLG
jgi:hypothetical protein